MITVAILINGKPIFTRSAVNEGRPSENSDYCKYFLDDGSSILHKPEDGAVKLSIEMLKTIKEQTR